MSFFCRKLKATATVSPRLDKNYSNCDVWYRRRSRWGLERSPEQFRPLEYHFQLVRRTRLFEFVSLDRTNTKLNEKLFIKNSLVILSISRRVIVHEMGFGYQIIIAKWRSKSKISQSNDDSCCFLFLPVDHAFFAGWLNNLYHAANEYKKDNCSLIDSFEPSLILMLVSSSIDHECRMKRRINWAQCLPAASFNLRFLHQSLSMSSKTICLLVRSERFN